MLAYAAQSRPAQRAGSPKALTLIVAGHLALVGVALTTRMIVNGAPADDPTDIVNVPLDRKPPPPPPPRTDDARPDPRDSIVDRPQPELPLDLPDPGLPLDRDPPGIPAGPDIGAGTGPDIVPFNPPRIEPVRLAARFVTPEGAVRPPYPLAKIRSEEEATLRLKLSIDPRGRVVAVEPIGAADPAFLDSARRHIVKAWRYRPASEDGVAVASTILVTLRFTLDEA